MNQTIDAKAKIGCQLLFLLSKSHTYYLWSHRQIKSKKFKDQKDLETKKTFNNAGAKNSSTYSQLLSQSSQAKLALGWLEKKDFYPYYKIGQGQNSNPSTINNNTIVIKRDRKVKVDLSHIQCYKYHKKGYYINKYSNKKLKNQYWSQQLYVNDYS